MFEKPGLSIVALLPSAENLHQIVNFILRIFGASRLFSSDGHDGGAVFSTIC